MAESSLPTVTEKYIMAVVKGLIAPRQPWVHMFGNVKHSCRRVTKSVWDCWNVLNVD